MGSSFDTKTVVVPIGDPGGDAKFPVYRAPTDAEGGGATIVGAYAVNQAATSAGTSFSLALHRYSNAGTPVVNGTVSNTIGGTASPWGDNVPKDFTLDSDYVSLDAGEWLMADYAEQTSGSPTNGVIVVHYLLGR